MGWGVGVVFVGWGNLLLGLGSGFCWSFDLEQKELLPLQGLQLVRLCRLSRKEGREAVAMHATGLPDRGVLGEKSVDSQ